MAVEQVRGCGMRKVGGLYLCGEGPSMSCDRLPYELKVCPVCGEGIKFSRGFQWIDWLRYAGEHSVLREGCKCGVCPVCHALQQPQPYGLLWIGEGFYSPTSFIEEALKMGVSRRIAAVPRNLKLGVTWVLLAHIKAVRWHVIEDADKAWNDVREGKIPEEPTLTERPGVFYAFRPQRLELLIWKSEATDEKLAELEKKSITPIVIPDGDVDHDPRTSLKPKAEERSEVLFDNLRKNIRR